MSGSLSMHMVTGTVHSAAHSIKGRPCVAASRHGQQVTQHQWQARHSGPAPASRKWLPRHGECGEGPRLVVAGVVGPESRPGRIGVGKGRSGHRRCRLRLGTPLRHLDLCPEQPRSCTFTGSEQGLCLTHPSYAVQCRTEKGVSSATHRAAQKPTQSVAAGSTRCLKGLSTNLDISQTPDNVKAVFMLTQRIQATEETST